MRGISLKTERLSTSTLYEVGKILDGAGASITRRNYTRAPVRGSASERASTTKHSHQSANRFRRKYNNYGRGVIAKAVRPLQSQKSLLNLELRSYQ